MTRLAKLPDGQQRERTRLLSRQSASCRIIDIAEVIPLAMIQLHNRLVVVAAIVGDAYNKNTLTVARDLLILTVELPGKSSDSSWLRGNSMKLSGGISNESGNSMFLLVACGVFIGVAATR
jgi:hypothetical protein